MTEWPDDVTLKTEIERVLSPVKTVKCSVCGRKWDTVSPCTPCAATKVVSRRT